MSVFSMLRALTNCKHNHKTKGESERTRSYNALRKKTRVRGMPRPVEGRYHIMHERMQGDRQKCVTILSVFLQWLLLHV